MRKELSLPAFALERPVTTAMVFLALLVIGMITYVRIPISMDPEGYQQRTFWLNAGYGNASPVEVERTITRPIEEAIRTMSGVESTEGSSSSNMWLRVSFRQGVDMAEAYNQLRDRLDRVLPELPEEVRRIQIRQWSQEDRPILGVDFRTRPDIQNLHTLMEEQVKRPLEAIDGVASVSISGTRQPRVEIELSREAMQAANVNAFALIQRLRGDNFALSNGWGVRWVGEALRSLRFALLVARGDRELPAPRCSGPVPAGYCHGALHDRA